MEHKPPEEWTADAAEIEWRPLHPRYVRRLQAAAFIRIGVVGAVGAAVQLAAPPVRPLIELLPWLPVAAWSAFGALALRALLWPAVKVARCGYAVREGDLMYKSGVLWRSVCAVPFNRVQHTKTDSSPLDRRFGLANLSVYPAGGGGQQVPGLGSETAERLRALISARIEAEEGADADAADAAIGGSGIPDRMPLDADADELG